MINAGARRRSGVLDRLDRRLHRRGQQIEVMIAAVIIAVAVMYAASEPVAAFIARHPTTKMLALSFLMPRSVWR